MRTRWLAGAALSASDYLATLRHQDEMKLLMEAALTGVHAFLTPSTVTTAMPLQEVNQKTAPALPGNRCRGFAGKSAPPVAKPFASGNAHISRRLAKRMNRVGVVDLVKFQIAILDSRTAQEIRLRLHDVCNRHRIDEVERPSESTISAPSPASTASKRS